MPTKVPVEKTLVIGCVHVPFEDEQSLAATLDFAKYWKPKRLVLNGDIYDLYAIMRHRRDPDKARMLAEEIDAGRDFNAKIRKAVGNDCEIIFNQGNHEFRYDAYLIDQASETNKVKDFSFEQVYRLDENKIRYNRGPDGYARVQIGLVTVGHFKNLRKNSADTAQSIVLDTFGSVIAHHSHRMGTFGKNTVHGRFIGQEGGCLCTMTPDYHTNPDWEQGFVLMQTVSGSKRFYIDPVRVVGGEILFDGKLF